MPSITLKTTYECAGGDHLMIAVTGDVVDTIAVYAPDLTGAVSEEEQQIFLKVLLRIAKISRTKAQLKTALSSAQGLTVTI